MCTSFIAHKVYQGSTFCVTGRSYDFDEQMEFTTTTTKRGATFNSVLNNGVSWKSSFDMVTLETVGTAYNVPFEGMNSAGLSIAAHEATGVYPTGKGGDTISPDDVVNYVLAQADNLNDALKMLDNINIDITGANWQMHYILFDADGNSLVVEFEKGSTVFYYNKSSVLTNDPELSLQLANLANYGNLTNWPEDGMVGLPGDWTSASRFVRATIMLNFSLPYANTNDEVIRLSKGIIASVSRVKGVDLDVKSKLPIFTQIQIIKDIKNRQIFWRRYDEDEWANVCAVGAEVVV